MLQLELKPTLDGYFKLIILKIDKRKSFILDIEEKTLKQRSDLQVGNKTDEKQTCKTREIFVSFLCLVIIIHGFCILTLLNCLSAEKTFERFSTQNKTVSDILTGRCFGPNLTLFSF